MIALFKAAAVAVDRDIAEFEHAGGMVIIVHITSTFFQCFSQWQKEKSKMVGVRLNLFCANEDSRPINLSVS